MKDHPKIWVRGREVRHPAVDVWRVMRCTIGFGVEKDKQNNPVGYVPTLEREILNRAIAEFGGATIIPVIGGWNSPTNGPVIEHGRILQIDNVPYADLYRARAFAGYVKDLLRQESVVYSVQNVEADFI